MSQSPNLSVTAQEEAASANERLLLSLWNELSLPDEHEEWQQY